MSRTFPLLFWDGQNCLSVCLCRNKCRNHDFSKAAINSSERSSAHRARERRGRLSTYVAGTIVKWQNMPKQMIGIAWNAAGLKF